MTTTHIRYIFLLLLFSTLANAKNVDVTFEVFHAKNEYLDVARQKAIDLQKEGFQCYIIKGKKDLSLRCNNAKTTEEMQRTINKMKSKDVDFTIVNRDTKTDAKEYKTLNEFYLGYAAFDRREYKKALKIFEYNYKKENNYEHAYAYALALMKRGRYEKALGVLKEYETYPKANKLSRDIATTFMYRTLRKKEYEKAHAIVDKYRNSNKRLHRVINKQEVNDLLAAKEYDKAQALAKKYGFKSKDFDIDYMKALALMKTKDYSGANRLLEPYIFKEPKAKNLYIVNTISLASLSYKKKNYKEALDRLEPFKNSSKKVRKLYDDILYNRSLANGWRFVDKHPDSALKAFKESCRVKKEYGCYSGMMYSYYNLHKYPNSLYLAEKLYEAEPKDELSVMAMRSNLKMKNYKEAKYWFDKTKNKKGLTSPYLLESFYTIDDYIKIEEYDEAQNIVDYLKNLYPTNIDILKREMELYIAKKEYEKAKSVAEEILRLDKNSTAAKYTLSLYEFEHQDYAGCYARLADENLTQKYQVTLKERCHAYEYVTQKDIKSAKESIEKIDDAQIRAAFYFDLGDMYASIDDARAVEAYKHAKELQKDDSDMEMVYLYSLKNFKKYKQLDKELEFALKNFPTEQEKLLKFKKDYEKERLYSYYTNKEYKRCASYANKVQKFQADIEVDRMSAWCSYGLKEYLRAKEKFAKINLVYGESNEDIYAFALAAYKNKEDDKAIESLDRIEKFGSDTEAFLVAQLYINLQEQERAREILNSLEPSKKRDEMLVKLNRSYTDTIYENSASVGMYYQSQTGLTGKSKFDKFVIPVDYDYYNREDEYHLYFDGDVMYLYNGYLTGTGNSIKDFGLGTTTQDNPLASDIGFMPKLGVDYSVLRAEIGMTPIGAKIAPELTWLLSGYIPYKKWRFGLKIEQKEVDETMLSFVGERAIDGTQEVNWGRVVKRGIEGGVSYDGAINLSLNLAYYPDIFGLNVEKNSEKKATVMAVYHPKVESISYVDVGAIVGFDAYEKNSNFFTYGHGGYFSPQQFFLGSLFTKFGDIISKDFYYQAKLGLGFEGFIVDDSYKFPLDDGIVNSGEIQTGYRDGGVVYKGAIQLGYKINSVLDLISGVSVERINGYEVQQAGFALVYRFDEDHDSSFNTFRLNHRVDKIIK